MLALLLLLSAMSMFSIVGSASAADQCICQYMQYDGPRDTDELTDLLTNSMDPAIVSLDNGTKSSLIQHMLFIDGYPKGMSGTDDNIQALYSSPSVSAVFGAILGKQVIVSTFDTRPAATDIDIDDFTAQFAATEPVYSLCTNCLAPSNLYRCCEVPGGGCIDMIAVVDGTDYYRIMNPLPVAQAGKNRTIGPGESIAIGHAPVAGNSYQWTPATGLDSDIIADPLASPTETTTYTVTVANSYGCTTSDSVTVEVVTGVAAVPKVGLVILAMALLVLGARRFSSRRTGMLH